MRRCNPSSLAIQSLQRPDAREHKSNRGCNQFAEHPASLDPGTLFMAGMHREPGVKLGLGHTPVSHESFAHWDIQPIQVEPTSQEELEGYEYWKEIGGGYF